MFRGSSGRVRRFCAVLLVVVTALLGERALAGRGGGGGGPSPTPSVTPTPTPSSGGATDVRIVMSAPEVYSDLSAGPLTYAITVTATGPATHVSVVDVLPFALHFVAARTGAGTCSSFTDDEGSEVVTCGVDRIAAGGAVSIELDVSAACEVGVYDNSATVAAAEADPVPGNNKATARTVVVRDPASVCTAA